MRLLIIAAAALAVAGPSFAAPFEPGVYLGVSGGRASVSSKYADNSGDFSVGGAIGYQYTPNFGFDVYTRGLSLNPFRGMFTDAVGPIRIVTGLGEHATERIEAQAACVDVEAEVGGVLVADRAAD